MLFGEKKFETTNKNCDCTRCKDLINKREKVHAKTWMRPGFYFKIVIIIALWFVFYLTADQISKIEPMKSFDPFQILGVEPGAEASVIKKAYRKLSLLKHPDKNPDDPLAVTEFIQITKAYTVCHYSLIPFRLSPMKLPGKIGRSMATLMVKVASKWPSPYLDSSCKRNTRFPCSLHSSSYF